MIHHVIALNVLQQIHIILVYLFNNYKNVAIKSLIASNIINHANVIIVTLIIYYIILYYVLLISIIAKIKLYNIHLIMMDYLLHYANNAIQIIC